MTAISPLLIPPRPDTRSPVHGAPTSAVQAQTTGTTHWSAAVSPRDITFETVAPRLPDLPILKKFAGLRVPGLDRSRSFVHEPLSTDRSVRFVVTQCLDRPLPIPQETSVELESGLTKRSLPLQALRTVLGIVHAGLQIVIDNGACLILGYQRGASQTSRQRGEHY